MPNLGKRRTLIANVIMATIKTMRRARVMVIIQTIWTMAILMKNTTIVDIKMMNKSIGMRRILVA